MVRTTWSGPIIWSYVSLRALEKAQFSFCSASAPRSRQQRGSHSRENTHHARLTQSFSEGEVCQSSVFATFLSIAHQRRNCPVNWTTYLTYTRTKQHKGPMSTGNSGRRVGQIRMAFKSCFPYPSCLSIHDYGPIKFGCLRKVMKINWVTMFKDLNNTSVSSE